jgi:hypothetical protein
MSIHLPDPIEPDPFKLDSRPWPETTYSRLVDLRYEKREREFVASLKRKSVKTLIRERQKMLSELLAMLALVDPSHPYLNACISLVEQCVPDIRFNAHYQWLQGIDWIAADIKAVIGEPATPGLRVVLKYGATELSKMTLRWEDTIWFKQLGGPVSDNPYGDPDLS